MASIQGKLQQVRLRPSLAYLLLHEAFLPCETMRLWGSMADRMLLLQVGDVLKEQLVPVTGRHNKLSLCIQTLMER